MKVSAIIPTYNEERDIGKCIESLLKQSYKNIEIIVVDDGSSDKTIDIVKGFKKVKLIKGEHKGPGFSRNLGVKKARGNILVFVDADMTFDKDYIKNLILPLLKDKKVIGSTHGLEISANTDNLWSALWGKVKVQAKGRVEGNYSKRFVLFRAIRKKKFMELGGFDPKYGYADDQTFWLKYKILPYIVKNATCYHKNPETLKEVYKQSKWIGASIDNFLTKPIIKDFSPLILLIISPLAIPLLSIKKCYENKDFKRIFPWMILFMTVRYFGTISGLVSKIYLNKNIR